MSTPQTHPSPIISSSSALLITLSFAFIYVGSLYLSKNARLSFVSKPYRVQPGREDEERKKMKNERWRDDPDVIRARLAAVSVATVVCCLGVFAVLFYHVGNTVQVCFYFSVQFVSFISDFRH
jgi:prenyl protein peptidase